MSSRSYAQLEEHGLCPSIYCLLLLADFCSWLILDPSVILAFKDPAVPCVIVCVSVHVHFSCAKICLGATTKVLLNFMNLTLSTFMIWIL